MPEGRGRTSPRVTWAGCSCLPPPVKRVHLMPAAVRAGMGAGGVFAGVVFLAGTVEADKLLESLLIALRLPGLDEVGVSGRLVDGADLCLVGHQTPSSIMTGATIPTSRRGPLFC